MDLQIKGKKALITGSTKGIGFAAAYTLAQEGCAVILNGRKQEDLDKAVKKIKEEVKAAEVSGVAADITTMAGMEKLTAQVSEVDILVNSLGIFEPKDFEDIPDEDWRRLFEVNVMTGIKTARNYLPAMKKKKWGRIVFVASESAVNIPPDMLHYGMTKTAEVALSRGLAETTANTNVTVNSVLPGPTRTEGLVVFFEQLAKNAGMGLEECIEDFFKNGRPSSLIQRLIEPMEIASLIAYLCSPLAVATNGAAIRCDGGLIRTVL